MYKSQVSGNSIVSLESLVDLGLLLLIVVLKLDYLCDVCSEIPFPQSGKIGFGTLYISLELQIQLLPVEFAWYLTTLKRNMVEIQII